MAASRRVYGVHAVEALIARRPHSILSAKLLEEAAGERLASMAAALRALDVPVSLVRRAELERLTGGAAHQGVVIEARPGEDFTLADFEALVIERGRALRVLALDGVQDPRNLGACLRTADAAGVDVVIVPRARSAALSGAMQKAATGAVETVPLLRAANLARVLAWLKDAGVWLVGAQAGAQRSLYDAHLSTPVAMVLGGEERGLRRLTRELCDELVCIPMRGTVTSLNVSVAAGIVLFELERQVQAARSAKPGA